MSSTSLKQTPTGVQESGSNLQGIPKLQALPPKPKKPTKLGPPPTAKVPSRMRTAVSADESSTNLAEPVRKKARKSSESSSSTLKDDSITGPLSSAQLPTPKTTPSVQALTPIVSRADLCRPQESVAYRQVPTWCLLTCTQSSARNANREFVTREVRE